MARPTAQAQDAIDRLLRAGWKRNQFSVRTERINYHVHPETGKQMYEYGDVIIYLKNSSKSERRRMAKAMADQGLHVGLYSYSDGRWGWPFISNAHWAKPGVWLRRKGVMESERLY